MFALAYPVVAVYTLMTEQSVFRIPPVFAPFSELIAAESTRHGGISPAPYASLNLGLNTADDPANVRENYRRFGAALGHDPHYVATAHQVHGTDVLYVTEPGRYGDAHHHAGYDALMTDQVGLLVGVSVADCVPVLIYDRLQGAVAAVHAGWRGTVGGIVQRTLTALRARFGTQPEACYAYVGTGISAAHYVVGTDVADQFAPAFVGVDAATGQPTVDLQAANRAQLTDAGVPPGQIAVSPYSTVTHNADYFSHRHERGLTGRMLAVIGRRAR